jgi:hypothetical protein
MEEMNLWIKFAENRDASYTGLVNDHNSTWCTTFKKDKYTYLNMLKEAIKELELELESIPPPS